MIWMCLTLALAAPGAGVAPPVAPPTWSVGDTGAAADDPWWERFEDPGLAAVLGRALDGNLDLAVAWGRVRQADALARSGLVPLLPSVNLDYTFSGETDDVRAGRTGFLTTDVLPDFVYSGNGQISTGLELDVTGRNVLAWQASRNDARAARGDKAALAASVASRVAAAWFDAGLAALRLSVLDEQLAAARQVLELAELRFARAEASAVDVLQQRQQIAAIEAQIPLIRAQRGVALQQLAVLTGTSPTELAAGPADLPALPARGGLGSPEDLLAHRPDLRAAATRVTAAWQRRMSRERAFIPRLRLSFNLTGSYSNTQRIAFGATGATVEYGSVYGWTVGAGITAPIFDGGASIFQLQQARTAEQLAATQLTQALLAAEAQVEAALALEDGQVARIRAVEAQVEAARLAWDTARARYAEGIGDFLSVLTTQTAWQNAALTLVQARRDALGARVQLYEALGGPWTRDLETPPGGGS